VANIPIHNETGYPLTDAMTRDILRDAQEHFGEEVQAIRVQSDLERHAFNARTHEVRYAFSPQDFGLVGPLSVTPEPMTPASPRTRQRPSRSAEFEDDRVPASREDVEAEEDTAPLGTSLESLEEGHDDEEDVFTLDDPNEEEDEEEDQDDPEDNDERALDADEYEV
jgi:hypothetical protein